MKKYIGPALDLDYRCIVGFLLFFSEYRGCVDAHFRFPRTNIEFRIGGVKLTERLSWCD